MAEINVNPQGNIAPVQHQDQQANVQDRGDNIVAKGVGLLKKMWLHVTGNAGNRHSQQLSNLRTQVKNSFGDTGLKNLEGILKAKGWSAENSTKLMSSSELESLLNTVEVKTRLDTVRKELLGDAQKLIDHPEIGPIIHSFLESEYSVENIDFVCMIDFALQSDQPKTKQSALLMACDEFIGNDAPKQINISFGTLGPIATARDALKEARQSGDDVAIAKATDELTSALQTAKSDILELIKRDSLQRIGYDDEFGQAYNDAVDTAVRDQVKHELIQKNLERSGLV